MGPRPEYKQIELLHGESKTPGYCPRPKNNDWKDGIGTL
jgi:hypothetical protein